MSDGKVVNLRGKKLYPQGSNKYAMTLQSADAKPIEMYSAIVICAMCKAVGRVYKDRDPTKIIHCPDCNGFGYLMRFLRADQIQEDPEPKPTGPKPSIG